jgi:integrase
MEANEQERFDTLYAQHLRVLKLRGYSAGTIDVYARAVRRLTDYFDCVPDRLSVEQLEVYFAELVDTRSWAIVRIDRNGLQFFWKFILKQDWQWVTIIKPPKVHTLPDVLTVAEVQKLISAARKKRYRTFILTTYSMGLRLSETLALQVSDIDGARHRVHIRRGKGHKDRFVPLPDATYQALRSFWATHRNPRLLFPAFVGSSERIRQTTVHMSRGGVQKAVKVLLAECGVKKRFPSTPCATVLPRICLRTV